MGTFCVQFTPSDKWIDHVAVSPLTKSPALPRYSAPDSAEEPVAEADGQDDIAAKLLEAKKGKKGAGARVAEGSADTHVQSERKGLFRSGAC